MMKFDEINLKMYYMNGIENLYLVEVYIACLPTGSRFWCPAEYRACCKDVYIDITGAGPTGTVTYKRMVEGSPWSEITRAVT